MGVAVILLISDCYKKLCIYCIYKTKKNLIVKFEKAKHEKWILNDRKDIKMDNDCYICNEEFQENDNVITLKCDKTHVFHRHCFSKYIKCQKEQDNNTRKCPMCQ